jgi:hypothetical protein
LTPGGLWDSNKYDIEALVKYDGRILDSVSMAAVTKKGTYEIIVYAFDPQTGNTGVDKKTVTVQ